MKNKELLEKLEHIIWFIKSTKEYYSDGVDEEIILMIEDLMNKLTKKGDKENE